MEGALITEDMRRMIGRETAPYVLKVERGDALRFLEATGETDPCFVKESWARGKGYGGAVLPPTFFCPDPTIVATLAGLERPRPFPHSIGGGSDWEFLQPVRVGDTLSLTAKIADLYEKQGSPEMGRMLFTVIEVRCTNQREELVGIGRSTAIAYEGAALGKEEAAR